MNNGSGEDKANLDMAYQGVQEGGARIIGSAAVFGRYLWNRLMRLLKAIGLMPLFVRFWWLFIVLAVVLLAVLSIGGVIFIFVAWSALTMEPKAENEFVVPLRLPDPLKPESTPL